MLFNINYSIIIFVTGAVFLAAIYHTVLYIHRRTLLLAHYSTYLWFTFFYTFYRVVYPISDPDNFFLNSINADETFQMVAFAMYIRFMGTAMDLDKKGDRHAYFFVDKTKYVILFYILLQIAFINSTAPDVVYLAAKIAIRIYLLSLGFFMLLTVILKRKEIYYNYLAAGAISIIFFGVISSVVNILRINYQFTFGALSWLMLGFFADVVFFSSAIGYRIKADAIEKEDALNTVIRQNEVLQQKEIEKIQAIYKTKEEERLRIANDLHDDIGASLSSLQIYSTIAEQSISTNPHKVTEMLQKISAQSKLLLENMSDIVWSMKTAVDSSTTLETKIKNFGVELLADRNINFMYQISDVAETSLQNIYARKNILLLIKEAMNNIAKYSQANEASVMVEVGEGNFILTITDNGIGFNTNQPTGGNGLKNIRYRVNELTGKLAINSSPERGTVICAIIPIIAVNEQG